jgi:anti-sigma B factor antagonist
MANERFNITEEKSVQILQFSLPVTLDTMEVDGIIESVLKQIEPRGDRLWVVDLAHVEYLGSSMLGLFVNMRERIRQSGGSLVLCGMSPALQRIFRTCCLDRLFTIAKSRGDAIELVSIL